MLYDRPSNAEFECTDRTDGRIGDQFSLVLDVQSPARRRIHQCSTSSWSPRFRDHFRLPANPARVFATRNGEAAASLTFDQTSIGSGEMVGPEPY